MGSRVLATGAVAAVLLLPTLSACSSTDEAPGAVAGSPAASEDPGAGESSSPSDPAEAPSPSPQPATGDLITVGLPGKDLLTLQLPTPQWAINQFSDGLASLTTAAGSWDISTDALEPAPGSTLDDYVAGTIGTPSSLGVKETRSPDRTVDGVEGYVVEGRGREGRAYEFGAFYDDSFVKITFELPRDNARADAWIESVLASATWL